jgi:hypothetical protein
MHKKYSNLDAAGKFIKEHFMQCDLAILAGSTVRGESTSTSDLDIVIIENSITNCYRETFFEYDWPIEAFIHSIVTCKEWIEKDIKKRKPSMPNMIIEGKLIQGSLQTYNEIRNYSINELENGPKPFSMEEDANERYFITDLLDDFIGSANHVDDIFILNELLDKVINYQLVKNGKWTARNKRIQNALSSISSTYHKKYLTAIDSFYKNENKKEIIELIESVLEMNGGRLFAGYTVGKINLTTAST